MIPAPTDSLPHTLPSYLRSRDGHLELVLHSTAVQDYYVCPRKFWLRNGVSVMAAGPKPSLNFGGAVHAALAHRYVNLHLSLTEVETDQEQLLLDWFAANPAPESDYRNSVRAMELIRAYNKHYPAHDWEVLAVEEEFEVRVGELTHSSGDSRLVAVPVYLAGRKDLVVAWQGSLWVVDHKTASDWGSGDSNSHLDEGQRSFQFRAYAWAERETQRLAINQTTCQDSSRLTLPVAGTIGNYLICRRPAIKPTSIPREQFHQEPFSYDSSTLDEWREECLLVAEDILRDHTRARFRTQDSGCGHWGRCEFYDYCETGRETRDQLLSSTLYRARD